MSNQKLILFFYLLALNNAIFFAQNTLLVGQSAPPLVLASAKNSVMSFNFQNANKYTFLYFWSSDVEASKENLSKLKKINKHSSKIEYTDIDGIDIVFVALQNDKTKWNADLQKYSIDGLNNYIALKGTKDYFVSNYSITDIPFSYLINEEGKVILKNPEINLLKSVIDSKNKNPNHTESPDEISGKIVYGNLIKNPFKEKKIYVTDTKKDTLKTITTNNEGEFTITGISHTTDLTLKMSKSIQVEKNDLVSIANNDGDILSDFTESNIGYEYKLTDEDLSELKFLEKKITTSKNIVLNEKLFASGENKLTPIAQKKLDVVVNRLKEQKNNRIEIVSHTDYRGDKNYNQSLSLKRSNSIAKYLVFKGIDKNRIKAIGKGESEPLNDCSEEFECSPQDIDLNRRTEFKFYEIE